MRIKILVIMILLAGTGLSFAAPTSVSDPVILDVNLNTLNFGTYDTIPWSHVNPFTAQGIGNFALTRANNGILGVDLVVNASEILWTSDPLSLANDFLFIQFRDADLNLVHEFNPVLNGTNTATILPEDLEAFLYAEAFLIFTPSDALNISDDAFISSSTLIVRYDDQLVIGGTGVNPIPAPGALLLGGLGCGLVGAVRRRM